MPRGEKVTGQYEFSYPGTELDVFAEASNWKAYWATRIRRWVRGDVLEAGAGIGANTAMLQNADVRSWICLEPDARLAATAAAALAEIPRCSVRQGAIASLGDERFDTILYIDVLEHIADDCGELAAASRLLRPGGHIVVLAPAHQFLFSEFDRAIGHYRRYNRESLRACSPPGCALAAIFYLDSVGILPSLGNRTLLRSGSPTAMQIEIWDKFMVPVSRVLDPLLGYRFGKTICGVWSAQ
jgi:SAM-dependent methyltransferase